MNGECEGATNRARFCSHHVVTREVSARTDQMNGPFGYCTTAQIFNTSVSCSARNQRGAVHNDAEYTPTGVYRRGTGSLEKQRAQARVHLHRLDCNQSVLMKRLIKMQTFFCTTGPSAYFIFFLRQRAVVPSIIRNNVPIKAFISNMTQLLPQNLGRPFFVWPNRDFSPFFCIRISDSHTFLEISSRPEIPKVAKTSPQLSSSSIPRRHSFL